MKLIIDIPDDAYKKIIADKYAIYDRMYYSIKNGIPLDKIRAEISEYKDDKIIHAERNEMIDIVLGIIDHYKKRGE